MAKVRAPSSSGQSRPPLKPALTPEAREQQMISLAYDLVEQRLRDGTASSQETTHFLKAAAEKTRYQNELLKAQAEMAIAKKEDLESNKRSEAMYEEVLKALRNYSGNGDPDEYID